MSIVPVMDLADPRARGELPSNIEAEQALLGCLLYQNEAFHSLPPGICRAAFHDPFHGALFDRIAFAINTGLLVDPVTLGEEFRGRADFKAMGGVKYLADLVDKSPPSANAPAYASTIIELWLRRRLALLGQEITAGALDIDLEMGGAALIIADVERDLLQMQINDRRLELVSAEDAGQSVMDWVDDQDSHTGVLTGLGPLDLQLGPILPGDLVLIGGRPSMGKSALAGHIGLRIAAPEWWKANFKGETPDPTFLAKHEAQGAGIIELNGEMSVGQMARRHMSDMGHYLYGARFPTFKQIRDKQVGADQREMLWHVQQSFKAFPMRLLKRTGLRISQLRSIVRRQAAEWAREGVRVGGVVVDHVGLLRPEGKVSGRYEAQMEIAIAMKELADELECPVFALIQLSREVERRDDKRPQLSDLRDAGGWEENADTVLFPFRDAYYAAREKEPDSQDFLKWSEWDKRRKSAAIEVIIAKLREGEAGQSAEVWARLAWNAIRGSEPDWGDLV